MPRMASPGRFPARRRRTSWSPGPPPGGTGSGGSGSRAARATRCEEGVPIQTNPHAREEEDQRAEGQYESWRRLALPAMGAGIVTLVVALVLLGLVSVWPGSQALLGTTALTLIGASLPVLFGGLVLLEARRDWIRACGGIGLALCLGGLIMFASWFPRAWGASLGPPNVFAVGEYVLGVTLMAVASSGAVAETVSRGRRTARRAREARSDGESVKPALEPVEGFTWGALPTDRPGVQLVISDGVEELHVEGSPGDLVRVEEGEDVARATERLRDMKGRIVHRSTEAGVGDQAQRLQAMHLWDSIELEEVQPWWRKLLGPFRRKR